MRIAFAGTPAFALPALHALAHSGHELGGVLTRPDRARGRGQHVTPSPVKQAALALGLPISQPATLATSEGQSALRAWRPDLLVVVAYGSILPASVLELPRLGCVNIHASLLPRWRGAAPIQRAILTGDAESGVTIMKMDAGLDTGPILLARRVPIGTSTTSGVLHDQLASLGAEALLAVLPDIEAGTARARPQPEEGVTYAAKIDKAEALIDWRSSAVAIERQIRAFNPWPIAETRWQGESLRILAARAEDGAVDGGEPGEILAIAHGAILVRCGRGRLAVTELQRPGRKALPADAFVNAGRLVRGQRLG